jgi:hypothetical protein
MEAEQLGLRRLYRRKYVAGMYDGNWHQVVFSYDATTLTATLYRMAHSLIKTNETIKFDGMQQTSLWRISTSGQY